jgi:hypothetical protein
MYQDPTTGKIVMELIRHDYDIDELPVFDQSNVVSVRNFSRTSWEDTTNQVRVNFPNRSNKYENGTALAQDMANITSQERVRSTAVSFPLCYEPKLAGELAARELAQMSVPLFKATLELNRKGGNLRPGDPFIFSWPPYGITRVVMRAQRFNLGDLLDGRIVIEAIQDEFATAATVFAAPEPGLHVPMNRDPEPITVSKLVEAPYFVVSRVDPTEVAQPTAGRGLVYALARRANGYQQGYSAVLSQDAFATSFEGLDHVAYPNSALLHTAVADSAGFSTTSTSVVIKLPQPTSDFLSAATVAEVRDGKNLFLIGDELMAYQTVTNHGDGTWTLGTVRRALLDTTFGAHAVDTPIYFIDDIDHLVLDSLNASSAIQARLPSFTDKGEYELAITPTISLAPNRRYERPLAPAWLRLQSSRTPPTQSALTARTVDWYERNRLDTAIRLQDDAGAAGEPGATYTLEFYLNGVLQPTYTKTGLTGTTTTITFAAGLSGAGELRLKAVRAGLDSRTYSSVSFTIAT